MIFMVFALALLVGCDRNQASSIETEFGLVYPSETSMIYHEEHWAFRGTGHLFQIHELPKDKAWVNRHACQNQGFKWGFFENTDYIELLIGERADLEHELCSKVLEEEHFRRVVMMQGHRLYYYFLAK